MSLEIRKAVESDDKAISDLIVAAFGDEHGQEIADLVGDLLKDPSAEPTLSLVMADGDELVGHVLFTNAWIENSQPNVSATILAPLSVHPDYQGQGIGGQLIREGLGQLRATGTELVFVLGHPSYYPKYGFSPAGIEGLHAPYPIPPKNADAWMVLELQPGVIERVSGTVRCAKALDDPKHWQE